jgi:hypothetical protein
VNFPVTTTMRPPWWRTAASALDRAGQHRNALDRVVGIELPEPVDRRTQPSGLDVGRQGVVERRTELRGEVLDGQRDTEFVTECFQHLDEAGHRIDQRHVEVEPDNEVTHSGERTTRPSQASPSSLTEISRISTLRTLPVTVIGKSSTISHVARDLVVRELAGREGRTPARDGLGAGLHPDPGAELLAVLRVGHPDDLSVEDVGVGVEELLDLARVDVLAAADDHVLDPAGDLDEAVLVHDGEVTGHASTRRRPPRRSCPAASNSRASPSSP